MINAKKIDEMLKDCMYEEGYTIDNLPDDAVFVEGIMKNFALHPERLKSHKEEVKEMLMELSDDFKKSKGGGTSFLNMCMDKHGSQWGEHINVEQLIVLGIGLNMISYSMPKSMWSILPGGMPYLTVDV